VGDGVRVTVVGWRYVHDGVCVTLCGSQCVGNGMWVRYGVRYGAFQGYATVRYSCALRHIA